MKNQKKSKKENSNPSPPPSKFELPESDYLQPLFVDIPFFSPNSNIYSTSLPPNLEEIHPPEFPIHSYSNPHQEHNDDHVHHQYDHHHNHHHEFLDLPSNILLPSDNITFDMNFHPPTSEHMIPQSQIQFSQPTTIHNHQNNQISSNKLNSHQFIQKQDNTYHCTWIGCKKTFKG